MLQLKTRDIGKDKLGTLVLLVCEDRHLYDDKKAMALIQRAKKLDEFNGAKKQRLVWHQPKSTHLERIVFIGLGKHKELDHEAFRAASGRAVKTAMTDRLKEINLLVPLGKKTNTPPEALLESLMEGAYLANHTFPKYKGKADKTPLKTVSLLLPPDEVRQFRKMTAVIETLCNGTILARDWVTTPSNDKRPEAFAKMIAAEAKRAKLPVTVWTQKRIQQKKMGGILAVADGSDQEPRLVMLEYKAPKATKTLALVGKGVTFDSGGLNLKTAAGIGTMKIDMAGAGAVAATMITVARLKPRINLIGVIPIVENMPSGHAYRPGDVITGYNGKTIEIGNTDAEGRLILADALAYVEKTYQPDIIIDLATLTGACMIALGDKIAGVFSEDDALAKAIVAAGERTFERCWQMPFPDDYREYIKSDLADIRNMSRSKYGGAITAALFLSEFIEKTRWAHIDIAGPALNETATDYCPIGGSGFGVRMLWRLINSL